MSKVSKKQPQRKYEKTDQLTHIRKRPDTYVGSKKLQKLAAHCVADITAPTPTLITQDISYIPAMLRIFVEIISNAIDNIYRSDEDKIIMTKIKIDINKETGETSVWNDGTWIPLDKHEDTGLAIPHLIFGELLTSDNYDDTRDRQGSGRNGYGAKLTNVFSTEFKIEIAVPAESGEGLEIYRQTWTDGMTKATKATVTKRKTGKPYTRVTYTPDFAYFGITEYSEDIISLYYRYIYDSAMIAGCSKVAVWLDGKKIPISNLKEYAKLFTDSDELLEMKTCNSTVVLIPAKTFNFSAFTNGVHNSDGGVHLDLWSNAIFRPLMTKFNTKGRPQVSMRDIKQFFRILIKCDLPSPEFSSQSKTYLTSPSPEVKVTTKNITALMKWDFAEKVKDIIKGKELLTLKKIERKKKTFQKIPGYDPANLAGGPKASECILIFTEGLSAKAYAARGIDKGFVGNNDMPQIKGRDYFGLFPLRGKLLNVKNAKTLSISNNKEIKNAIAAINLRVNVDYTIEKNFSTLQYGKIAILCDADVDGIHIKGLLINMFHTLFPTLLKREDPFIISMETPIVRVFEGRNAHVFYDETKYKEFIARPGKGKLRKKYYKGLGTSSNKEVMETFGERVIKYTFDDEADTNMTHLFNSTHTSERKTWLGNYDPSNRLPDGSGKVSEMTITDFINYDMIKFSIDDCGRSIPHLLDGLKESQRKILYSVFKKKLTYTSKTLKVAQLSGYVAEHSGYHHGEQCLYDTIIKLANDIVGMNNIPLLFRDGQYGCLDPETPILMWDGGIKEAKNIQVGDILIGDDGTTRTVRKTVKGNDTMYDIVQGYGNTYRVNSYHILTLSYSMHKTIFWENSSESWVLKYFDDDAKCSKSKSISTTYMKKEDAYEKILHISDSIDDNHIFDINVQEYLKISKSERRYFKSVKNTSIIQWKEQSVPIDPYIFGHWLGDGDSNGNGFATEDHEIVKEWVKYAETIGAEVVHTKNDIDHENYHYSIRRKGSGKAGNLAVGNALHSSEKCKGCLTSKARHISCNWTYTKYNDCNVQCEGLNINGIKRTDFQPFKEILKKNNFMKNKHIPEYYIQNSKKVRLELLAGFVDSDGTVRESNGVQHVVISQEETKHGHLIDKLQYIANSLGFRATTSKSTHTRKNGGITIMKNLFISGDIWIIPTKIKHKKLINIKRRRNMVYCNFTVKNVGMGEFCGWDIDKNERFLLGDFTVTHNTRLQGGKDAAAGRYIFTKADQLTRLIFPAIDDNLLPRHRDDGDLIEPMFYIPVIPMILCSGCRGGIGTGWSCSVPTYNPLDLIASCKKWITKGDDAVTDLHPWFRNFKGTVTQESPTRHITTGVFERKGNKVTISELPIGMWTDKYKEFLEDMLENKIIKSLKNYSTPQVVKFVITESHNGLRCNSENLKLTSAINTTNMVLFTPKGKLKKFKNTKEIIINFCKCRMSLYDKRRAYLIKIMENEVKIATNKMRYLDAVMNETLIIFKRSETDIIGDMETMGLEKIKDNYDYLLNLTSRSFSQDKLDSLQKEIDTLTEKLEAAVKKTGKECWLSELATLKTEYTKWQKKMAY